MGKSPIRRLPKPMVSNCSNRNEIESFGARVSFLASLSLSDHFLSIQHHTGLVADEVISWNTSNGERKPMRCLMSLAVLLIGTLVCTAEIPMATLASLRELQK